MDATAEASPPLELQCMEIWGGNQAIATALAMPGLDAWIYSRPDGDAEGGGDVHYASSCAAGAISRVLIADVSGHGEAVAGLARRLRKLMQRYINQHKQTRFVRSMSREFGQLATGGTFATAVAFTYDAPTNQLQLCNAGHPPPLIYRKREGRWSYLEQPRTPNATNFPLGIDEVCEYEEMLVPVEYGDFILSYTDALPEARTGPSSRLGQERLLELISQLDVSDPPAMVQNLLSAVDAEATIDDDVTIFLFSPNGTRKHIPLKAKLLAPFKVIRAVARSYIAD